MPAEAVRQGTATPTDSKPASKLDQKLSGQDEIKLHQHEPQICAKYMDAKKANMTIKLKQIGGKRFLKQEFVRPRWPYDMRPSARAEKYIRDAGP